MLLGKTSVQWEQSVEAKRCAREERVAFGLRSVVNLGSKQKQMFSPATYAKPAAASSTAGLTGAAAY